MKRRETLLTLLALGAVPLTVKAEQFPGKPITLICPWPAGGTSDVVMRAFARAAGKSLGQPIMVEDRPGASGTLGAAAMVSARPDGYTLTQTHGTVLRLPHMQKVGYDPLRDLTYIIGLTGYTFGIAVRADAPWKTFGDMMAWAKENPGKLAYGSPGIGSGLHIVMEEIATLLGVKLLHVPFKGAPESLQSLLGGHTMAMADSTTWAQAVDEGRVRLLVTWGTERTRRWPNVPILKEVGVDIAFTGPYGIAGPRGMDPQVVRILHDAFRRALDDEEVRQTLDRLEQPIVYLDTARYTAFNRSQFEREKAIVERFGLGSPK